MLNFSLKATAVLEKDFDLGKCPSPGSLPPLGSHCNNSPVIKQAFLTSYVFFINTGVHLQIKDSRVEYYTHYLYVDFDITVIEFILIT